MLGRKNEEMVEGSWQQSNDYTKEMIDMRSDRHSAPGMLLNEEIQGLPSEAISGINFAPLSGNARKLLRQALYEAYLDTHQKCPELNELAKLIDERFQRMLLPSTMRDRMFDREQLEAEIHKKDTEYRGELDEYAKLKVCLVQSERELERDEATLHQVRQQLADHESSSQIDPLLRVPPPEGDYVRNFLAFRSRDFSNHASAS